MKYDLESILTCVKNDENWIKKLVIGSLYIVAIVMLIIIPILSIPLGLSGKNVLALFILCFAGALVIGLATYGFCLQAAQDYLYDPKTKLPEWNNFLSLTFTGFKAAIGSILFYLPLIILDLIILVIVVFLVPDTKASKDIGTTTLVINVVMELLYWGYSFFYCLFEGNFLKKFNLFEFLNFAQAYKLLKGNFLNYFILILLVCALSIILGTVSLILLLTIIGILLIPFIIMYTSIIGCILTARFMQIANEPKNVEEN